MLQGIGNPFVAIGIKSPSQLSKCGALFVAQWEGFRSTPYNDGANNATVGYGHLLHFGPVTNADLVGPYKNVSRNAALKLLRHDAAIAAASVRHNITTSLEQWQFDALCDFAYNCGPNALHGTRVQDVVNRRNFSELSSCLAAWVHDSAGKIEQGLVNRRHAEARLFLTGLYGV